MTGRATDRKKHKEVKELKQIEQSNAPAEFFVLPDSLPTSEVDFPVLVKRSRKANWNEILESSKQFQKSLNEYTEFKEQVPRCPFKNTESDYIQREVFTLLLPALEQLLVKAKIWKVLGRQKSFFNGIDYIAQVLWNSNPRHPARKEEDLHIFNMPWVRKHLLEHPRQVYPKSWLWTEDYAATIIQKSVRQFFVQKDEDVQEMRAFWEKLSLEHRHPEVDTNPFLAKHLASSIIIDRNRHHVTHSQHHGHHNHKQ